MLAEKFNPEVNQEKRRKFFSSFNHEIVDLLYSSDNPEYLAKKFDKFFLKLLRLIKYSNDRNRENESELSQDTNNLLMRFLNFIRNYTKNKAIQWKIANEQKYFFNDIREFLNAFQTDTYFTKVHNSIWPTSLEEYKDKSIGEEMFQNVYGRERWLENSCEGGSCSYRTVLLYKFFEKLKEAWLDIDIKIYRFKNLEDMILGNPSWRHCGLAVNFQWKDYLVGCEWIFWTDDWKMIKSINHYIDTYDDDGSGKEVLKNFKKWKQKETGQTIFFDNINEFLKHVDEFPEYKKISLYVKIDDRVFPVKFDYTFSDNGVRIGLDDRKKDYILSDNELSKEDFIKNFMEKIWIIRDTYWLHYITEHERNDLKMYMNIVKDKIDTDKLHQAYTAGNKWKAELEEWNGNAKLLITPKS